MQIWAGPAQAAEPPQPEDSIVLVRTVNSLRSTRGSGFIVGDGGWVVTASHVVSADLGKSRRVSDRTALVYTPWTGRPYEAKVVAVDGVADLALLRLPEAGFPALRLEGTRIKEAPEALAALKGRSLQLYGFPLAYGEATVASLARAQHNDSTLREIATRGETNLCILGACKDAQPGWSGGPVLSADRRGVVAVFHSLYHPKGSTVEYPAASLTAYLADLLKKSGVSDPSTLESVAAPTVARDEHAAERMAVEMRSLSWSAVGNWKRAEEEERELLKLAPSDALARVELGKLLIEQQKAAEAVAELKEAVRLAPRSVLANYYLGRALHLALDPLGAEAALRAALAASPGEVEPQLALAEIYAANQKNSQAEETLRAALQAAPDHPVVTYRLGTLLRGTGKGEEGLKLLAQSAELASSDPELSFIGLAYARALDQERKFKEAEAAYRRVVRADPENAQARYYFSLLLLRSDRLEEAQAQLNSGLLIANLSESMVQAFRGLQEAINKRAGMK